MNEGSSEVCIAYIPFSHVTVLTAGRRWAVIWEWPKCPLRGSRQSCAPPAFWGMKLPNSSTQWRVCHPLEDVLNEKYGLRQKDLRKCWSMWFSGRNQLSASGWSVWSQPETSPGMLTAEGWGQELCSSPAGLRHKASSSCHCVAFKVWDI